MKRLYVSLGMGLLLFTLPAAPRPVTALENVPPPGDSNQHQTPSGTTLYFPDYVDGGGWSIQLVLSNVDPDAAVEVVVEVYDPDGRPVLDLLDSDLTLELPALGTRVLKSVGSGAIRRGWIQVETDVATVSGLLTYRHARSGIEVGVKPVELGPQFALFVEESPTVGAGVAVFKPDISPRLELRIHDEDGNNPLEGEVVFPGDFHQSALTLPQWFSVEGVDTGFLDDFRGLLFLGTEDESPFAPLGLRFGKGTSSLSAVPAIRTQGEAPQETNLVFPDYVDGGGWSVQLVVSNVDPATAAEVRVEVYDPEGQPVLDLFDSDLRLEVPALGSRVLRSTGSGAIRRGWIQVEADAGAISGLLTYRHTRSGVEVGVEPARLGKQFALFVEESGTVGAGLALFKPEADSRIELRLRDEEGDDPLNGLFLPRKDFQQEALTLTQWFDVPGVDAGFLRDFRGLLFLRTGDDSGFAPLGLRFGKGTSSLSAVPAIRIPDGGGIDGGHAPPPTVTLSASPSSIDRGQTTTLTWSSTSVESAVIEPGIGAVPTSGTRRVSPNVTTTYRITVTGADGQTATASATVTVAVSERAALGALYEALDGAGWTHSDNWLTDAPLRDWYGVEVDSEGRVIGLRLSNLIEIEGGRRIKKGIGLTGVIPPELGSLLHLRVLDLSSNQLQGEIPPEIGNLSSLTWLDLSSNQLEGPIPTQLGALARLEFLSLWGNRLKGEIPKELGALAGLRQLSIQRNQLTGPIPAELGSLADLRRLDLNENQLTGAIPAELGRLAQLEILSLGKNHLTGEIPMELGALARLEFLSLWGNRLKGEIPKELGALAGLRWLAIQRNQLTGEIPAELGALADLRRLDLNENQLTGAIPAELGLLAQLEFLSLGKNYLTEEIPADLGALADLEFLDFGRNNLTGKIPAELGKLVHLRYLGLWGNQLTGEIPAELGLLVQLENLSLNGNQLTGEIPAELGALARLKILHLSWNHLTGPIPPSFLNLDQLNDFDFRDLRATGLCAPGASDFVTWLQGMERYFGVYCNEADVTALDYLYRSTGGDEWANTNGWTGDGALSERYGVRTDSLGRVTGLDLSGNGLAGRLPGSLYRLGQLTELRVDGNALSGRLPWSLTRLPLQEFHYGNTDLCIPNEAWYRTWLNAIPSHEGTGTTCAPPSNRDLLLALYDMTGGPNWAQSGQWGTPAPLKDWHGVRVDESGRVTALILGSNQLEGEIPAELGRLSNLGVLDLGGNQLEGGIPSELGSLTPLQRLNLSGNALEGEVPAELGSLAHLQGLNLSWNELEGKIPTELGNLSNLRFLELGGNRLEGEIPAELLSLSKLKILNLSGNRLEGEFPAEFRRLSNLEVLHLDGNELTGSVPPELGQIHSLKTLGLMNNTRMSGVLPASLTSLTRLEALLAGGTGLCAPSDAKFRNWLEGVEKRRIVPCFRDGLPTAYLTQAVQSREFPVPLVAGEKALLRVFVTSERDTGATLPPVRATFYRDGVQTHMVNIPRKSASIPNEVTGGDLTASVNAEIPGWVLQPGLEMVVDIDPQRTLDSSLGVTKRIPENGRLAVEVRMMPDFHLTVIPLLWRQNPDSSTVEMAKGMEQDPEGHELLRDTRTLLPIGELEVTAHAPVLTSTRDIGELELEMRAIRAMEGSSAYYLGMVAGAFDGIAGRASRPGWTSVSTPNSEVIAHELGHNLNLQHALCGGTPSADPSFPDPNGSIGVWGYDFLDGGRLVPPQWRDLMLFCDGKWIGNFHFTKWIGDYHFTNALRYRLQTASRSGVSSLVAAPANALLLWGGVDSAGVPFLEPAFVVDAPASLPQSNGDYEITGRTSDGDELFSLSFDMPELADGDARSSFAFVLPAEPEWAGQVSSIMLSGPHGGITLDKNTDRTVTILRDPKAGQIRAILHGVEAAPPNVDATVSTLSLDPGLERLTSRGIPDPEDWTQ